MALVPVDSMPTIKLLAQPFRIIIPALEDMIQRNKRILFTPNIS